jgi:hypothetical protein
MASIGIPLSTFSRGEPMPGRKTHTDDTLLIALAAGQEVATLEAHSGKVLALVFSPSGRRTQLWRQVFNLPSVGMLETCRHDSARQL